MSAVELINAELNMGLQDGWLVHVPPTGLKLYETSQGPRAFCPKWGWRHPGKFDVIYIDPPWAYNQRSVHTGSTKFGGGVHGQYPVIKHHEMLYIMWLIGQQVAAANCVMFMWAVNPQPREMLDCFDAAGFAIKTKGFTWIKLNPKLMNPFRGPGHYTSSNSEDCWIGVKGKLPPPAVRLISQVVMAPIMKHSAKPAIVRSNIELMYPEAKKIEIFSRDNTPGWASIGNDIDGLDIREAIPLVQAGYYDLLV